MTYKSLKPDTDYYVTVTTEPNHMSYIAYKISVSASAAKTAKNVRVGKAKANKKYVKKYKKIFTKKNAGKKVTVK